MSVRIGQSPRRKEDLRLVTGAGAFAGDMAPGGALHLALARSPHAHARIRALDLSAARAMPGVALVASAADLATDGVSDIPPMHVPPSAGPRPTFAPAQAVLARTLVRHVGEPVAAVLAATPEQARDAAEAVRADWEPLPAVTGTWEAGEPGAAPVWPEAPDNLSYVHRAGDAGAVASAFAGAAHTVRVRVVNNRVIISSIEPRAVVAAPAGDGIVLWTGAQTPHRVRTMVAKALGLPEPALRVVVRDTGGAFGMKNMVYNETVLVPWAARRLGRPVRWTGTSGEGFVSDSQARDNVSEGELALDAEGRILGLRVRTRANVGAYMTNMGALAAIAGLPSLAGPYAMPAVDVEVRVLFTNTVRIDVFRGAGRPEAVYLIERLMEEAARATGIDRLELRRRNLIGPGALPFTTPFAMTYDAGDYPAVLETALKAADWSGFPARRRESEAGGRLRGIAAAPYLERNGGGGFEEPTELVVEEEGRLTVLSGMTANGQGHETAFAQIVADRFGLELDEVAIVQGDTARVARGLGTAGSRSLVLDGSAIWCAMDVLVERLKPAAADMLEAAPDDLDFAEGAYVVAGTDRRLAMRRVLAASAGARAAASFKAEQHAFANGCHVAEVEVDPGTGAVAVVRHTVVQDSGRIVNPMIAEGQIHGGVAHGIGQAVTERTVYDGEGQLLSGSLMDYAMPRADEVPDLSVAFAPTACPSNPLGAKGCGEAGAIASPPAIVNAALDALRPLGVRHLDMPLTPESVWRAVRDARA